MIELVIYIIACVIVFNFAVIGLVLLGHVVVYVLAIPLMIWLHVDNAWEAYKKAKKGGAA